MKRLALILVITFVMFFVISGAFGAGVIYGRSGIFNPAVVRADDRPQEIEIFWQVWDLAHNFFVDREQEI